MTATQIQFLFYILGILSGYIACLYLLHKPIRASIEQGCRELVGKEKPKSNADDRVAVLLGKADREIAQRVIDDAVRITALHEVYCDEANQ
jgi:hypothetical protein